MRGPGRVARALVLTLVLAAVGCGGSSSASSDHTPSSVTPSTVTGSLETLIDQRVLPTHAAFATAATDLSRRAGSCRDLDAIRAAWRRARVAWDAASVYRLGPAMDAHLAATVDYWPLDAAGIDELVRGSSPLDDTAVAALGALRRGLPGIEHVAFGPALDPVRCSYVRAAAHVMADETDRVVASLRTWKVGFVRRSDAIVTVLSTLAESVYRAADEQLGMPAGRYGGQILPAQPELIRGGDGDMALRDVRVELDEVERALHVGIQPIVVARFSERPEPLGQIMQEARDAVAGLGSDLRIAVVKQTDAVAVAADRCRSVRTSFATTLASLLGVPLIIPVGDGD